jgi:hypothetical protein
MADDIPFDKNLDLAPDRVDETRLRKATILVGVRSCPLVSAEGEAARPQAVLLTPKIRITNLRRSPAMQND